MRKIPRLIFIVIIALLIILLTFSTINMTYQKIKLSKKYTILLEEQKEKKEKIEEYEKLLEKANTKEEIERIARDVLNMKRDKERVFQIQDGKLVEKDIPIFNSQIIELLKKKE